MNDNHYIIATTVVSIEDDEYMNLIANLFTRVKGVAEMTDITPMTIIGYQSTLSDWRPNEYRAEFLASVPLGWKFPSAVHTSHGVIRMVRAVGSPEARRIQYGVDWD